MKYFTSDLHMFHNNVIKFCDRPFNNTVEMQDHILMELNKLSITDELYILGDVAMNAKWALLLPSQVKCKLHLIAGNHDSCFNFQLKSNRMRKRDDYLIAGWSSVMMQDTLVLEGLKHPVLLSHFPYKNKASNYDNRYEYCRPVDNGLILLHGHLHNRYLKLDNMIDVGFDNSLTVLSERDIVKLATSDEKFIPSRLTEFYKNRKEEII